MNEPSHSHDHHLREVNRKLNERLSEELESEKAVLPRIERRLEPLASHLNQWLSLLVVLLVGFGAVALLLSAADEVYEWISTEAHVGEFVDMPVHEWGMSIRSAWATPIVAAITQVGGQIGMVILTALITAFLAWRARSWRPVILIGITALGSVLLTVLAKRAFGRERPPREDMLPPYDTSPSFPSGHTLNAVAIMTMVIYCCWLQFDRLATRVIATCACAVFVLAVAFTRLYLAQHWFTDILQGALLGLIWALVVIMGHRVFTTVRAVRRQRQTEMPTKEPA